MLSAALPLYNEPSGQQNHPHKQSHFRCCREDLCKSSLFCCSMQSEGALRLQGYRPRYKHSVYHQNSRFPLCRGVEFPLNAFVQALMIRACLSIQTYTFQNHYLCIHRKGREACLYQACLQQNIRGIRISTSPFLSFRYSLTFHLIYLIP